MSESESVKKIILEPNLQKFFFEGLETLNKKSLCPVPASVIYYSSDVLEKFVLSQDYFDTSSGKVREKILGIKLLEASQLNRDEQKKVFKEVGDTALILCGYFAESTQKRLVDASYYAQIGKTAYSNLNSVAPAFLDIPSFYQMFSTCFESITTLITLMATQSRNGSEGNILFKKIMQDQDLSDRELLVGGVLLPSTRKVS